MTKLTYLGTLFQLVSIPQPPEPRVQRTGAPVIFGPSEQRATNVDTMKEAK